MSNQIQITGGAKVRNLNGVLTGTSGVVSSVPLGAANGVATLDSAGKVPLSQLPSSVITYLGTWNAATNTPTLVNGTGDDGDLYICNVAGTVNFGAGPITFAVGDWVIYGSGTWQRSSGATGTVTSVGLTSTAGALTISNSPITTSGNISLNFSGNSGQYVSGDGNLVTFPSIITQAQNLVTEVYNSTGATLSKGTVVYINGGHGNLPTVAKAIATSDATSAQTYGVVRADITNNNNGYVTVFGNIDNIDTQAYSDGTQLYLSGTTAGAWTSTKPSAPIHLVYVGIVTRSHPTQGVVEIRIQNGYELGELHDVAITSVANNDGIFYNSSNDLWENKTIAEVLGYTPANDTLVVKLAGTQTITGSKTFSATTALNSVYIDGYSYLKHQATSGGGIAGYTILDAKANGVIEYIFPTLFKSVLDFNDGADYTYTFPASSGTIALTSNLSSYVPYTGATTNVDLGSNHLTALTFYSSAGMNLSISGQATGGGGYTAINGSAGGFDVRPNNGGIFQFLFSSTTNRTFTLPDATGTIALTSNLSSYVPYTGATANVDLGSNALTTTNTISGGALYATGLSGNAGQVLLKQGSTFSIGTGYASISSGTVNDFYFHQLVSSVTRAARLSLASITGGATRLYTLPDSDGTIALTSNLSAYVPYSGATGAVNLGAYDLTVNGINIGMGAGSISTNTRVGKDALRANTTGANNSGFGWGSLYFTSTGINNTAIGSNTLYNNTTGEGNTAVGASALGAAASSGNTAIGYAAGYSITTGSYNTIVGNYTGTTTMSNNVVLADGSANIRFQYDGTNTIIGQSGNVGIGTSSPSRKLSVFSTTADSHIAIAGTAPSVAMLDALTGATYQAKFGLATASNNFSTGSVAGDFVISSQTGSTIFAYNSTEAMRINTSRNVGIGGLPATGYRLHIFDTAPILGIESNTTGNVALRFLQAGTVVSGITYFNSDSTLRITNNNGGVRIGTSGIDPALTISSTGLSTFSRNDTGNISIVSSNSYINAGNLINFVHNSGGSTTNGYIGHGGDSTGNFVIINNGINALTFARSTGAATFSNNVSIQSGNSAIFYRPDNAIYTALYDAGSGAANGFILNNTNGEGFHFKNGSSTIMRMNSSGNVGIGTTSPGDKLTIVGTGSYTGISVDTGSTTGGAYYACKQNGVSSGFFGGSGAALGDTSTDLAMYAETGKGIRFYTNGSVSERMRITSNGYLLVNSTDGSVANTSAFMYLSPGTGTYNGVLRLTHSSTNVSGSGFIDFWYNTNNIGSISQNGTTAVAYNTTSDYRLKEDFKEINGLEKINLIKVYDFKFKNSNDRMDGVIAHELQEVLPYAVTGEKDAVKEDGTIIPQGVDYSKLVPILVKAIQEQQQQIEELKAKIN